MLCNEVLVCLGKEFVADMSLLLVQVQSGGARLHS